MVPAAAQTWDTSGNSLLQGTYYFRHVIWSVGDLYGNLSQATSLYGNISFDGNGNYTITNAKVTDSNQGNQLSFPNSTGTYSISASGYGYLMNPLSTTDSIYGLVSKGIFIASSTENTNGYNDLFIAAQLASPAPANGFFSGSYTLMQADYSSGSPTYSSDCQLQFAADGAGNIGTVRVTGYVAGSSPITQNISGVRYYFSNGAAVVNFPTSSTNLITGQEWLYFSPDGNFVFGGSPDSWDIVVGVRSGGAAPSFSGTYYQGGVYQDESLLGSYGVGNLSTYYGSFKAAGGTLLAHQRLLPAIDLNAGTNAAPTEYMYADTYTLGSGGTYSDSMAQYVFGAGGAIRIGIGNAGAIGVSAAIQAPTFTPSGVFIDPTGVVNAGSSAMFTSGVAPGELITIYGSNLAPSTASDGTFPMQLAGVQVMVNNRPAPVYYVDPNQVSAVVPYGTTELVASIQVINNGVNSNTVTSFVDLTSPGVFTNPSGGIGYAAALHSDYSPVTPSNPAQAGEVVSVYLSGLGDVSPAVADGAPAPTSELSNAIASPINVYIAGQNATTSFIGLAPGLVALYQINVQIPATTTSGNASLDIQTPDYYVSEAWIPVGTASSSAIGAAIPQARMPVIPRTRNSGGRRRVASQLTITWSRYPPGSRPTPCGVDPDTRRRIPAGSAASIPVRAGRSDSLT